MKRSPLRLILLLGMLSITGALITQIYWLRKALQVKESNFDQAVMLSLRRAAERLDASTGYTMLTIDVVKKISQRRFVIELSNRVDCNLLDFYLRTELAYPGLNMDFEYSIIDLSTNQVVFTQKVDMAEEDKLYAVSTTLPVFEENAYNVEVFFPHRAEFIGTKMTIWIFSSAVLIIAVLFFAYTIYIIHKQLRLLQLQKDYLSTVAHQFKTPLSTISLAAQTLKQDDFSTDADRLRMYAQVIDEESHYMRNQVDQLLHLASLEQDKISLKPEPVHVHQLIEELVNRFSMRLQMTGGTIRSKLHASDPIAVVDKTQLTHALWNLIDNAIKYSEEQPDVTVSTRSENGQLYISVADKGIGIRKEHLKQIFDKFYRVPTGNVHNVKGFGIGLHHLKLIANAHQWKIAVQSEPQRGSTFTLIIPHNQPELQHAEISSPYPVS
ncbi:MAG: HAMP domain-containing sensor histidine kinase [Chitinophagales bacterium]|nr:HAMP domain-containing histidine kinase [Chitinophagales bacterium]MDW8393011.1 HAMP domain-containing sensor histidine kinase [Chitinophagales bacterium]